MKPIEVTAGPGADERAGEPIEVEAGPGAERVDGPPPESGGPEQGERPGPKRPLPPEPIDRTIVGSRPSRVAGSAHIIREEELERTEYDDPHRLLLTVPGVYVRGEDGFGLRPNIGIRGVNSDRSKKVTLMEDGVLFGPAPYSAPAAYYFPIMTRMRSVRVVKGPSAVVYGPNTIGGAIDLLTQRVHPKNRGTVDLAAGQYGYGKVHAWQSVGNAESGIVIEGVHLRSSGFKALDGGGDTGFHRNEWMAKFRHVVDPTSPVHNELTLKLTYSDETSNETYLGLSDADFRDDPYRRYRASANDRMQWHRTSVVAGHLVQFDPALSLKTQVYRHDLERAWNKLNRFAGGPPLEDILDDPTGQRAIFYDVLTGEQDSATAQETLRIGPNHRVFVSQGVQTVARWRDTFGDVEQRLEYGVRYHNDSIDREHTEDGYLMQGGRLVADGNPTITTADNRAEAHAVAMHALDTVTLGAVTVNAGLRVEFIRTHFDDDLNDTAQSNSTRVLVPGAGIFYAIVPDLGALAGVYRGFSPLAPGQPDDREPETSTNYEAGLRYDARRTRAELIGFFNDYQNLTSICTISSGCVGGDVDTQFDAGAVRVWGLEAHARSDVKVGGGAFVPLLLSYTLTQSEFQSSFQSGDPQWGDVEAGDELPYIPEHQLAFGLGLETRRFGLSLNGTYVGEMREIAGSGEPEPGEVTDAFFTLDVGGRYRPSKSVELYATVQNVLDDEYIASRRPFGARPGMRRWARAGVKFSY